MLGKWLLASMVGLWLSSCADGGGQGGGRSFEKLDPQEKSRVEGVTKSVGALAALVELEPSPGVQTMYSSLSVALLSAAPPSAEPTEEPVDETTQKLQSLLESAQCEIEVEMDDPLRVLSGELSTSTSENQSSEAQSIGGEIPQFTARTVGMNCPFLMEVKVQGSQSENGLSARLQWSYEALADEAREMSGLDRLSVVGQMLMKQIVDNNGLSINMKGSFTGNGTSINEGNFRYKSDSSLSFIIDGFTKVATAERSAPIMVAEIPEMNFSHAASESHDLELAGLTVRLQSSQKANPRSQQESYRINGQNVTAEEYLTLSKHIRFPGLEANSDSEL